VKAGDAAVLVTFAYPCPEEQRTLLRELAGELCGAIWQAHQRPPRRLIVVFTHFAAASHYGMYCHVTNVAQVNVGAMWGRQAAIQLASTLALSAMRSPGIVHRTP
jgi:hypothetical protein